jgi:uncharacterized protein (DUF1684 family)
MKCRPVVWLAVVTVTACSSGPPPPDTRPYQDQVLAFRAEKDQAFRAGKDSPIPEEDRSAFPGLSYYPVDPAARVPSFLTQERVDPPIVIELQTSGDERRKMRKVGTLGFSLAATPYQLTAFADVEAKGVDRLFVPFGDLTNVSETYRGGRYLELDRTSTGLYDLDFNRAYHPFCVYNPTYICPVPPPENRLPVAIPAGEKLAK